MDQLYLLRNDFADEQATDSCRVYYCPSCAVIEGVFSYYPGLRERLAIVYVDFLKPRLAIIALLGEAYQGCPVLVLDEDGPGFLDDQFVRQANDRWFISSTTHILTYLAKRYGVGFPHP